VLDAGLLVDRSSRKRIGIRNWDFREKQPAERLDRSVGDEHVMTLMAQPARSERHLRYQMRWTTWPPLSKA
jgi:hypothetical protein